MLKIKSQIRVRKSVYNPSNKFDKYLGKKGTILKYLGKREQIIGNFTDTKEWYLVKFGKDKVEMCLEMFDGRTLKVE